MKTNKQVKAIITRGRWKKVLWEVEKNLQVEIFQCNQRKWIFGNFNTKIKERVYKENKKETNWIKTKTNY